MALLEQCQFGKKYLLERGEEGKREEPLKREIKEEESIIKYAHDIMLTNTSLEARVYKLLEPTALFFSPPGQTLNTNAYMTH